MTLLAGISGCGHAGQTYSYTPKHPDELPASITMSGGTSDWSYEVKKINGKNAASSSGVQRIAPGEASIDLLITGSEFNPLMANFAFTAVANENYELRFIAPREQKDSQTLALADSKRHILQRLRLGTSENALMPPKLELPKPAVVKLAKKRNKKTPPQ